jgi:tRNA-2-methylthio-N6-dimethylallyladenosine synthase
MERIKSLDILSPAPEACEMPRISLEEDRGNRRKLYIESYGCQMNFSDSEIVTAILQESGFDTTSDFQKADVILLNTCAIRENAELKVRNRLKHLTGIKRTRPGTLIGVLGCMAERLKAKFLEEEKIVDMVVGPDAYRDLPKLIEEAEDGQKAINVFLSREETYADITPVRLNSNGVRRSFPSCGAATTCVRSAWCPLPGAANGAATPIRWCRRPGTFLKAASAK